MYAVIESGGKQYRVELGSRIQVDRLDVQPGESVSLDRVLLVVDGDATAVGRPLVDGATVSAEVLGQDRGEKVVVFKYKPKARTRVKKGFRAELTTLRISDIAYGGRSAAQEAEQAETSRSQAQRAAAKAAEERAAADRELAARLASSEAADASGTAAQATRKGAAVKSGSRKASKVEPQAAEAVIEPETPTTPAADAAPDTDPAKDE